VNKKILLGIITAIDAVAIFASSSTSENADLDVSRTYGTISTYTGSPILGNPSAPVTIVEFGDYQCHQCHDWYHNVKPSVTHDYINPGKVNLIFLDLAFVGNDSANAAQASCCAKDQEFYWDYHDLLYNSQEPEIDGGWAYSERLKAFAFSLGLDMDMFDSCLDSGKYSKRVQYNVGQAREHGVQGTPRFFIVSSDGQQQIGGAQPFTVFKQILDATI